MTRRTKGTPENLILPDEELLEEREIILKASDGQWLTWGHGIMFKPLRLCHTTGTWTVLFKARKGASFASHKHLGATEYYLIKGSMTGPGIEIEAGDYGYEPLGCFHPRTTFAKDSILYLTNYGPLAFVKGDLSLDTILDVDYLSAVVEGKIEMRLTQ